MSAILDERRRDGLCATCGFPLTDKERAYEGVGGSYVRCDECVQSIMRGDWGFVGVPTESALQRTTPEPVSAGAVLRPPTPEGGAGE